MWVYEGDNQMYIMDEFMHAERLPFDTVAGGGGWQWELKPSSDLPLTCDGKELDLTEQVEAYNLWKAVSSMSDQDSGAELDAFDDLPRLLLNGPDGEFAPFEDTADDNKCDYALAAIVMEAGNRFIPVAQPRIGLPGLPREGKYSITAQVDEKPIVGAVCGHFQVQVREPTECLSILNWSLKIRLLAHSTTKSPDGLECLTAEHAACDVLGVQYEKPNDGSESMTF